nr:MAG TPA: hypothetical protein [Caudoviricetes sp.]
MVKWNRNLHNTWLQITGPEAWQSRRPPASSIRQYG